MRDDKIRVLRVVYDHGVVAKCPTHPHSDLCEVSDIRAGDMNGKRACQGCLPTMLRSTTKLDRSQIVIYETREVISDFMVNVDGEGNQLLLF